MRTTIDIDTTVLEQLKARQRQSGGSLGTVASELLATALALTDGKSDAVPFEWAMQDMRPRVDLSDADALERVMGIDR